MLPKYDGSNQQIVSNAIQHCLNNADRHKYSQIVFPAIGTGFMGYPIDVVADIFKKIFTCFRGKYINNILIVIRPNAVLAINVSFVVFMLFAVNLSLFCFQRRHNHTSIVSIINNVNVEIAFRCIIIAWNH